MPFKGMGCTDPGLPEPPGMSVVSWCACHSITKANYYYRLRRVRKACPEAIQEEMPAQQVVPVQPELLQHQEQEGRNPPPGLDISIKGFSIHVTESTSIPFRQRFSGQCSMLNDATCFKAVYIVCGYTDLRSGMDRLAALVEAQTGNRPYVPDTLYLLCGRRTDRIKGPP